MFFDQNQACCRSANSKRLAECRLDASDPRDWRIARIWTVQCTNCGREPDADGVWTNGRD